jgi:hypothetical protein
MMAQGLNTVVAVAVAVGFASWLITCIPAAIAAADLYGVWEVGILCVTWLVRTSSPSLRSPGLPVSPLDGFAGHLCALLSLSIARQVSQPKLKE